MSYQTIPVNDIKVYVTVIAEYRADGRIIPMTINWPDDEEGREFVIDKLLDVCDAVPQRAGGHGIRYRVRIGRRETYLFFERLTQKWFVEKK